jgi:hypothetical protein
MYRSFVLIITLFAVAALGQSPSKVLKRAEKALGGTNALQMRSSITMRGRITRLSDGSGGEFRLEASKPNSLHIAYDIAGEEVETGYNGRSGWRRDSRNGLQTLTGDKGPLLQALAAFRNSLWLNAKADKVRITSGGKASVNSHASDVVVFTSQKGLAIKIYFDSQTGLPIREELGDEIWDLDDYRSVGTLKMPYAIGARLNGQDHEIRLEDVSTNKTIAASVFDFPKPVGQPLPDLTNLFSDLKANQERIEAVLENYAYTRKIITRELGKDGVLRETSSETQQISFYKGYPIERTIERDGKALSASQQADEDKDVTKRTEEIDKKIAKTESKPNQNEENDGKVLLSELLKASNLLNPRRERFRGRDVIVFDFEPNPAFDMKNAKSMLKFFGKVAGVIWVDEKDKQLVKVEAYLANNFSIGGGLVVKLKKGASFIAEQERVNDEIWLPSLMEINLAARVFLFKGLAINQVVRSYDYRRFQTEVKDAKVNDVQKP